MPTLESQLTVRSLAEIAWVLSRVGRWKIENQVEPRDSELKAVWQSVRQLQRHWDSALDNLSEPSMGLRPLTRIATQLFATELVVRVWAAILSSVDAQTGKSDLTRIARNSVSGLVGVRHRLLATLLAIPGDEVGADLDRLRRRCDRWTDLLIGTFACGDAALAFAFDSERARDFAEEYQDSAGTSRPADLLIAAGVRLSFLGQLPDTALELEPFETLVKALLGGVPETAFLPDGTLIGPTDFPDATAPLPPNEVLLPGIRLAQLRRRFS